MSSRSSAYLAPRQNPSQDYHTYVSSIERSRSFFPNIPQYPNVFKAFNNRANYEEKKTEEQHQEEEEEEAKKQGNRKSHKNQSPETPKTVQFGKKPVEEKNEKNEAREGEGEFKEFIQQKRKGFELCKWTTFKL